MLPLHLDSPDLLLIQWGCMVVASDVKGSVLDTFYTSVQKVDTHQQCHSIDLGTLIPHEFGILNANSKWDRFYFLHQ